MLTLWYAPGTVALAVHVALEDVGAEYDLRKLSFPDGDQSSPAYLTINPKGRVPALQTPQGLLTETLAILSWIAGTYPDKALEPTDPFARAQGLALQTYLASTVHVAHAHKLRGSRWSDDPASWEAMRAKVTETMTACAMELESIVGSGPWALGDSYSTADPYLYTICRWLEGDGVDTQAFPALMAHRRAMQARPEVARVLEHHGGPL